MTIHSNPVSRRTVFKGAGLLAALGFGGTTLSACSSAEADPAAWPEKSIKLLSGYNPGGSTDLMGQGVVAYMNEVFDETTKMEFMPGSSGLKAAEYVKKQPADGYTQYLRPHTDFEFVMMMQGGDLSFDDFTTIGCTGMGEFFLVVAKESAYQTLDDLVAKAKDSGLNYGSSGAGSGAHIASAQWAKELGATLNHVPFEGGGPALEAILGNHVDFLMVTMPRIKEHITEAGRLRVLACCGAERSPDLPEVPTLMEAGYDVDLDLRHTVSVHADTPQEIVTKLTEQMEAAVQNPDYAALIEKTGYRAEWQSPSDFETWSKNVRDRYTPIMTELGLIQ
jgi:tripartite-type tricarboxylate transporter receptor subunit TctC